MFSVKTFMGSTRSDIKPIFPVGRSICYTTGMLSIAFINPDSTVRDLFVLDPGKHDVMCPSDVFVEVNCDKNVKWHVRWPNRFNPFDPVRVEASVLRPKNDREEMRDYLNELVARSVGGDTAEMLRSGKAVIDLENDNYDEDEDEDQDTPLSIHQMGLIMDELQKDIVKARSRTKDIKDIEEEAPPIALKTPLILEGDTGGPPPVKPAK